VNSVELGVIVAILSTAIGVGLAFVSLKTRWRGRRVVEAVATLPIGLPPVVFSAAILITVISVPGLSQFYGTIVPVIIADVVVTLPFAMRVLSGALITVQNDLLEASSASGAGLSRTLRSVLVPLLLPAIANSAIFVFVRSFLQLGAIVFLVTPGYNLLPTEIFNYWGTGSYGAVDALNVISVVIPLAVLLVVFAAREAVRRVTWRRRDAAPAYVALSNARVAGDTP
jgi:iron(III) transport system permease protein